MSVQPLTSFDPQQLFKLGSRPEGGIHRLDTKISALSISQEFSGRLNVTTADGDRVTLVTDRDDRYGASAVRSFLQTPQGSGTVGAEFVQSAHAHNFGIAVSGDLNEAEVTDLEKVFEKVSSIFRGLFQGHDDEAKAHTVHLAEGFRGLEQLSSLDLSVEIVRSVTVVSTVSSTPGGAPGTTAAIPQSSNGTTAPTPSSDFSEAGHLALPVSGAQFASLVRQVFDAVNQLQADLEKVRHHLPAFLDKLREEFARELLRPEPQSETAARNRSSKDASPTHDPSADSHTLLLAYRSLTETSLSLSLQA
ncbi:MAG TPA: hypothetical protein PKD12_02005 [Nitrospira sp.]|nr:hypothetical protein [Nitrospira sp.]